MTEFVRLSAPKNCTFSENDWNVLSRFWHPVAWCDEVKPEEPFGAVLLDTKLVVYRTEKGVTVARDVCPHRGAKLSNGRMIEGELTCPYHAFHFNDEGMCTKIPAHPEMKIADKMCLKTFPVIERYNIIWTCLNPDPEPLNPMPDWDDMNDDGVEVFRIPGPNWKVSAARHCENFHDPAHFSVVHEGTFGSGDFKEVPRYKVNRTDIGLEHSNTFQQVDRHSFEIEETELAEINYGYRFTFPFSNHLVVESESTNFDWYKVMDVAGPVSATESRIFLQIVREEKERTENLKEDVIEFEKKIVQQDIDIVEHLEPLELELGASDRVLIPADLWSVSYRRGLADYGLRTGMEEDQ